VGGNHEDRVLAGAPDTVHALAFSPDSKWLIVAGSAAELQLWNVESGQPGPPYTGANHQTYALVLAPDGRQLLAAGADGQLTVWHEPASAISASASPASAP
jgi:WD40 repeat protein